GAAGTCTDTVLEQRRDADVPDAEGNPRHPGDGELLEQSRVGTHRPRTVTSRRRGRWSAGQRLRQGVGIAICSLPEDVPGSLPMHYGRPAKPSGFGSSETICIRSPPKARLSCGAYRACRGNATPNVSASMLGRSAWMPGSQAPASSEHRNALWKMSQKC